MSRWRWGIAAALAATLAAPITAQENRAVPSAPAGSALPDLLEDVTVLRMVSGLQLTSAQTGPLVQRLQAGMARVQQAGQADGAAWTAAARTLRQAIPQAAGGAPTGKADAELARAQQLTRGKELAAREQARTELRALLEQLLTPAQKAALQKMGRDEMLRQRLARLESADFNRIDRMGRVLDRLREASPQEYPQERQRFAMQMADLPGGWDAGRQNPAGTARRGGGDASAAGPRGRRGDTGGLQSEQQRLRREQQRTQARAQLADPARRAQMRQFQLFADQVRAMPPQAYAQRRAQLATQLYQSQSQTRAQTASPEQAIDAFIDRYLLVPRAPIVLAERLEAMG